MGASGRTARPPRLAAVIAPSPYAPLVQRVPVRRTELTLRGGTTRCWVYGPDDARRRIVFLHGLRGDHHGLEPIIAHLPPDLRAVVPDLPGFGESPPLRHDAHDVAGYTAWARELLATEPGAVLAGHSFGSIVAASAARGLSLPGLVLVNPIAARPRGAATLLTVLFHRATAALPERAGTALLRHPALTRIASVTMATTRDRALRRWIHAEHGRYFSTFASRDVLMQAFHASVRHDVAEFAAAVDAPTLLVAADRDDIAPLAAQRALVPRFADARLAVVPGTGHLAHYEAPAAVAAEITTFLATLPQPAPRNEAP
jgi:pimeloyl-ACP methyl ester carboxylesterase